MYACGAQCIDLRLLLPTLCSDFGDGEMLLPTQLCPDFGDGEMEGGVHVIIVVHVIVVIVIFLRA